MCILNHDDKFRRVLLSRVQNMVVVSWEQRQWYGIVERYGSTEWYTGFYSGLAGVSQR